VVFILTRLLFAASYIHVKKKNRSKYSSILRALKLQYGSVYRPSSYFLVCASYDEVSSVHGDHISSELAGEVVLLVEFSPLDI
jgi:hypothetical protein